MSTWVERLQEGDQIRLVKESETAVVREPYESPLAGVLYGCLCITRRMYSVRDRNEIDVQQIWFMNAKGCGFDHTQLILPICQEMIIRGNELHLVSNSRLEEY
jgi:hypothetical protein